MLPDMVRAMKGRAQPYAPKEQRHVYSDASNRQRGT